MYETYFFEISKYINTLYDKAAQEIVTFAFTTVKKRQILQYN